MAPRRRVVLHGAAMLTASMGLTRVLEAFQEDFVGAHVPYDMDWLNSGSEGVYSRRLQSSVNDASWQMFRARV